MKQLSCEMCGSTNVIKQDGLFVCQTCGTKYSVEEARKMMMEGTVEVEGTVKIDQSDELKNLYEIARRAKDSNNSENALKYYDQILVKDPNSWEAQFYVVYYKSMGCTIGGIALAAASLHNCIPGVLTLVKNNVSKDKQEEVISEIATKLLYINRMLFNASKNHYEDIDFRIADRFIQAHVGAVVNILNTYYRFADDLINNFDDDFSKLATLFWSEGIDREFYMLDLLEYSSKQNHQNIIQQYAKKIRKYDEGYISPLEQKKLNRISIFGSPKCPFCKTKLTKDIKFCTNCGARVNK